MNEKLEEELSQVEFCKSCEIWNKHNPSIMVNPFHHPLEQCGYKPTRKIDYSKIDAVINSLHTKETIKQIDKYLTDNND